VLADGSKVEVKRMPLGRYVQFFQELKQSPEALKIISDKPEAEVVAQIPAVVASCWSDLVGSLSVATGISRETLSESEAIGLEEAVDLVSAVIEVNGFFEIASKVTHLVSLARRKGTAGSMK